MDFLKNDLYIKNIFQIRDNIFNISKFNEKKVKICNTCEVILIPSKTDILESNLKDILWYSEEDFKSMRNAYLTEISIIGRMNNVSFKESIKIWKDNMQNNYYSSVYVLPDSSSLF
jgi:hypothetical protein